MAQKVWKHGFGESVEEVTNTISVLAQRMQESHGRRATGNDRGRDHVSRQRFEADVNETTRAAAQLMQQFGVDGSDAMDIITAGFQRGGNYSDELLSSIFEYSTQFENLGFTADEMLGIFVRRARRAFSASISLLTRLKESFLQLTDGADNTTQQSRRSGSIMSNN